MSPVNILSIKSLKKAGLADKFGNYKMKNRTKIYRRQIEMVSRR
jgi:hypothetical protein